LRFLESSSQRREKASTTASVLRRGLTLMSRSTSQVAKVFKQVMESLQEL
jgi:hypothetical protein